MHCNGHYNALQRDFILIFRIGLVNLNREKKSNQERTKKYQQIFPKAMLQNPGKTVLKNQNFSTKGSVQQESNELFRRLLPGLDAGEGG
jgi:hypothetical protein